MAKNPVIDDRQLVNTPEPRPEDAVGSEGGAASFGTPRRTQKRTEKFEIDAVTQEQEGGSTTSEPEP